MSWAALVTSFVGSGAGQATSGILGPASREISYVSNMAMPNALPSPEVILASWQRGFLGDEDARAALMMNGVWFGAAPFTFPAALVHDANGESVLPQRRCWEAVARLQQSWLTPEETLVALNRDLLTRGQAVLNLQRLGYVDAQTQVAFLALRLQIPGFSDLERFAVREAWDQATVDRFGYDQEFPEPFQFWMERQGYGGDARTTQQLNDNAPDVTWPKLYWRAHWSIPSPTQAYEMFHRLRPERVNRYAGEIPGLQAFTFDDLKNVLKVHDYAPNVRGALAAIAYNKPRLLDLQRFYRAGLIDRDELYQQHLDYGYSPYLARIRTAYVVQTTKEETEKAVGVNVRRAILATYKQGTISKADAMYDLYRAGLKTLEEQEAFERLPVRERFRVSAADPSTKAAIQQADLETNLIRNRAKIARIRKRYQRGQWTKMQTEENLRRLGMQAAVITTTLDTWDDELASGKLMLSTEKIRGLVVKGLLPIDTARTWLFNLGWRDPELSYLLIETQRDLALEFAKAQEKRARTLAQQQKALADQMRAAQRAQKEAQGKLLATLTPAKAIRYYTRGVFGLPALTRALQSHGYAGTALAAALADAEISRRDYLERQNRQREKEAEEEEALADERIDGETGEEAETDDGDAGGDEP